MGNKLGRRRQVVDERYTRPQGLYVHKDVDIKKLRKLILESKLAPCYPGDEECYCDLEECPICFLHYIFGACSSGEEEIVSSQDLQASSMIRQPSHPRANRDDEFDIDLEEIMVMEAIWQSIQENNRQRKSNYADTASSVQYVSADRYISPPMATVAGSLSSPSGGLACAIAALAERQQMGGESSLNHNGNMPAFNMIPSSSRFYDRLDQVAENYPPAESPVNMPADGEMMPARDEGEWDVDHGSEVAEAGTIYASSDVTEDAGGISTIPQEDEIRGSFHNVSGPIVPESYEEQMMLAMAEARAMTSCPGVSWQ